MCCSCIWVQYDDDFRPYEHQKEVCGCLPMCHCGIFDTVFWCAEWWGYLFVQMKNPTVVCNSTASSLKLYIPLLKDVCVFVPPFFSSGVLTGLHAREKCTCGQLVDRWVFACLYIWSTSLTGIYFWCFVVFSIILYPLSCLLNIKGVRYESTRVRFLWSCV